MKILSAQLEGISEARDKAEAEVDRLSKELAAHARGDWVSGEVHKALKREKKEVEEQLAKIRFERDKVQPTAAAVLRCKAATRIYCHQLVCVTLL